MSTISIAKKVTKADVICQGDIFENVKYCYINEEKEDGIEIIEFTFPLAIIVSQGCDVISMGELIQIGQGKTTKFMPSILMCPIYDIEQAKLNNHINSAFEELKIIKLDKEKEQLFNSKELGVAKNDWHYRYHTLDITLGSEYVIENSLIDFKHYFSIPASYLVNNIDNRLFRLEDLFAEQVTLKFATFISRVAIPENDE